MKTFKYIIAAVVCLTTFSSCLKLQEDYEYKPANIDNNVYMTTWEFIESRQDIFSQLKRAIIHSEIDQSIYKQTDRKYTYLLLNNGAFSGSNGILANNGVTVVENMNKETLKNILLYHTVNGYYHGLGTLNFDAINVITLWDSPDAIMTLKLNNSPSIESYSRLVINDTAGSSTLVTAETSNIFTTNGVVHVVNKQIIYKP